VPLADGSTANKEVIIWVEIGLGAGKIVWERSLRAYYMYNIKPSISG